ncbi:MAG: cytochrome c3 family protein [Deltaproteobacteria bacterium]|nr:cytochrome c3 family protein [Deltaproteobacteria bacterium]
MSRLHSKIILLLFLTLILSLSSVSDLMAARKISAQRECSTCHIMWLEQLRQKEVEPLIELKAQPVVIAGKQGVVSTERMCFTCHDGFILDSRFAWKDNKKNFHPIGVTPKNVNIPKRKDGTEVFPLDTNGQVYCGTCHSAHGVEWSTKDSPIFLRESNKDSMMCMICHIKRATGPTEGNHPINKTSIDIPKKIHDLGGKTGSYQNQVICQSCHRVHGAREKKLLLTNNDNSRLCGICHSDRYAKNIQEAREMHTHPVNIVSEKVKIADEVIESGGRKGTNGEIICQTCHRPHYAKREGGILVDSNKDSALCKKCHQDKKSVQITKHNLQNSAPDAANAKGQTTVKSGPCSACHIPHKGKGPKMWARELSGTEDNISNMCKSCHSEGEAGQKKPIGNHSHPVNADLAKVGGETSFPLFGSDANPVEPGDIVNGKVVCATCHNVHQWNFEDPEEGSLDEGDGTNSFLRKAAAPAPNLCADCHRDKKFIVKTDHDMRVTSPKTTNTKGEDVSKTGVCGQCHMIHNAPTKAKMWAREVSGEGDIVAQLCLSCHNENGPAKKKQTGQYSHPTGKPVSNLNITISDDGSWSHPLLEKVSEKNRIKLTPLPFFDDEGKRVSKGNVSCGSCHDPHIWDAAKVKEGRGKNIEGDGSNSFLRIKKDPDSALCKNCHVEKRSVVVTKHNLQLTAPGQKNILGVKAKKGDICGSCHLPHNGSGPKMWARNPFTQGDQVERLCKSCHEKDLPAEKKQVGKFTHPVGKPIKNLGITPESKEVWTFKNDKYKASIDKEPIKTLPLYAKSGEKVADGNVSCGSCHDPHQWDSASYPSEVLIDEDKADKSVKKSIASKMKKVKKEEGDAKNSFLRIPNAPQATLCKNCHVDKRSVELSKHNMNIFSEEEKNVLGLTTRKSGTCSACHLPHNGVSAKMWARPVKPGNAVVSLCKSCHEKGLVAEKKLAGDYSHPLEADIRKADGKTSFPLYNNKGQKKSPAMGGRVVCTSCHDPHQWDARNLMTTAGASRIVEGTARNSFLRKPAFPSPDLCIECHENNKYIEFTDHDFSISAPTAKNTDGKTVTETGKCGFCHMIHNSPNSIRMWAHDRGPGDDGMETLCRSCHFEGKIAKKKIPKNFNHPIEIKVTSNVPRKARSRKKKKKKQPFPVFEIDGKRTKTGIITCPTCHNPHLWSPDNPDYGPGTATEGNSTNSFLRGVSDVAFCSNCHGFDAIFRFKYYHSSTSRKRSVPITGGSGKE